MTDEVGGNDVDVESLGWALLEGRSAADAVQIANERRATDVRVAAEAQAEVLAGRARDDARLAAFETGMKLRRLLLVEQRRLGDALVVVQRASESLDREIVATRRDLGALIGGSLASPGAAPSPVVDVTEAGQIASDAAIDAWLGVAAEPEAPRVVRPPSNDDTVVVVIGGPPPPPPPPPPKSPEPPPPPRIRPSRRVTQEIPVTPSPGTDEPAAHHGGMPASSTTRFTAAMAGASGVIRQGLSKATLRFKKQPFDPRRLPEGQQLWYRTVTAVRTSGLLMVAFAVYQLYGTGFVAARAQDQLRSDFRAAVAQTHEQQSSTTTVASASADAGDQPTVTAVGAGSSPEPDAVPKGSLDVKAGRALAVLRIPKIGLDDVVLEGTSTEDLRKGPGHYRGTPLPGEPGNAAIAGHRTTYGAPFGRLGDLHAGDEIDVTTLAGDFKYTVESTSIVKPNDLSVLEDKGDDRITLTTCHPKFSASERLVVVGKLTDGAPSPAVVAGSAAAVSPASKVQPTTPTTSAPASAPNLAAPSDARVSGAPGRSAQVTPSPAELIAGEQPAGFLDDRGALWPAAIWGGLLFAASRLSRWGSRRLGHASLRWVGLAVVILMLLPWFEAISRLLPANY